MSKNKPDPVAVAWSNAHMFTAKFLNHLPSNLQVYEAFEREAKLAAAAGMKTYSARTIVEVLRHREALQGKPWKLDNDYTPYLARLFGLMNPSEASLFNFRIAKAVSKSFAAA